MDGCVYVKKDKFTNSIMDLYSSDLLSVRPKKTRHYNGSHYTKVETTDNCKQSQLILAPRAFLGKRIIRSD